MQEIKLFTSSEVEMADGPPINMQHLIVLQVSGLVAATAEVIAQATGEDVFQVEGSLYRILAVNCEEKRRLTENFAQRQESQQSDR
jgi:hypothetical protein